MEYIEFFFETYTNICVKFFFDSPFDNFLYFEFQSILPIETNNKIEDSEKIVYSAPEEQLSQPTPKWGWFKSIVVWSLVALVASTAIIPSYNYILLYIKISNDWKK